MLTVVKPKNLSDLCEIMEVHGDQTKLLAGGTDTLAHKDPFADTKMLIDLCRFDELQGIEPDTEGWIRIGAATTHQQIVDSPIIRRRAHLLALACAQIGSVQIRNRGTIGGNLANASPAADSVPALVCFQSQLELFSTHGTRRLPINDFFRGPGTTAIKTAEIIKAIYLPPFGGRQVAFYKKIGQRRGMCCAIASVAFLAKSTSDGRLHSPRIALGAVAPNILDAHTAANVLDDKQLTPELITQAATICSGLAEPIDDLRASADYRKHVVSALLRVGLLEVYEHMLKNKRRTQQRKHARQARKTKKP